MTRMTTPFEYNVGDRFNPNDEELTYHYLMQKLLGNDHLVSRIPLLDPYQFDPSDLPYSDDGEGHFFSPLHPKFPGTNDGRINRSTGTGSWLATGKHCEITSQHNGEVNSGIRKIYVHSRVKDEIKYVMHEYSIPNLSTSLVLCKVMKKMPSKKVKKRKEAAELPLPICNEDNSTPASSVMKKKTSVKKSKGPGKKVKRTDEKADMPCNKENITPVPDEGSDLENWITSDKSDFSTYNNIIDNKDQQTGKSTCDNGGTPASTCPVSDFTIPEDQVDPEILPHLQSFLGYDQLDYSRYDFTQVDPPLITEQVSTNNGPAGTSMFDPEEDPFDVLETLWA
ncbi:PREDICTED: NAC domain-containing protein 4-like isoform X2 [Populus euphratica]|uniref:NAC domain-containing protein 4-like isoform X2 n=1 Tax=Populus euphratica TaxID=75702 RepID=A0AAJ6X2F8_POPEU|nr:PREDICTED: NAC domain-containing protein 4-like isoform X2 [Populus euphratica]